ncbi:MAG: 4-demethylwyosine synthase TYW1 [Nitrososphaerota archaeon]|nr:4-demethylwyosine synthase TYW1 [Candidatus Calditenuaceae archaeon]MDW8073115.1 4-demethylwyosine synthase TYW1 [Nitrososphaerota archaeon]
MTEAVAEPRRKFRLEVRGAEKFIRSGYRLVGKHSAVKICHWTKSALRGGKHCYKSWYGVESHRCLQMTPSLQYCNMACVFCWRFHTINRGQPFGGDWERPETLLEALIEEQRRLLSGFKGNSRVERRKFFEAMLPTNIAISLDGEPTLYPYLPELIRLARSRGMTTFLVTNGTMPERLEELLERDAEPTNLYISFYGPDKETHLRVNKPLIPDSWERVWRSLSIMPKFKCRKVIRLTLVKYLNLKAPEKYAEAIRLATPDFVECKGYVHVGESQKRLTRDHMPTLEDIKSFASELKHFTGYVYAAEDEASKVVLLANPASPYYREARKRLSGLTNSREEGHMDAAISCGESV